MRGVEYTVSSCFSDISKKPLYIKWFLPASWYIIFLVLLCITSHNTLLNKNLKSFTKQSSLFLAEMKLGWLDISWRCTETCGCEKVFNVLYPLHNSLVFLPITNSTKQFNIFMIWSHRERIMYFSILFFLVWEFFTWQTVIIQEWEKFITIREWPGSALRKKSLIFNIRNYSQTNHHQAIYGTCLMTKVMKNSHHQMVTLKFQTIYVL